MDYFLKLLEPWYMSCAALLFFFVLRTCLVPLTRQVIHHINLKLQFKIIDDLIAGFTAPINCLLIVLGIYFFIANAPITSTRIVPFVERILRCFIIYTVFWGIYNVTYTTHSVMIKLLNRLGLQSNPTIANILSTFAHIFIVVIGFVAIAKEWNYDISGFIASLGIVSVAVAFAAKDTLANVFGSFVIIVDHPFKVGDEISTNGVEGTVESISFRSTCIRTFPKEKVYIPNSLLSNTPIVNYSAHNIRRVDFILSLEYGTSKSKMEEFIGAVKVFLQAKTFINPETVEVTFKEYNSSSLDIRVICYTKPIMVEDPNGNEQELDNITPGTFRSYMSEINLGLLEIIEQVGVSCAFPSTSVYFANDLKTTSQEKQA